MKRRKTAVSSKSRREPPEPGANTDSETYPCMAHWLEAHGTIEFGRCPHTRSFIRVLDEGGMIWCGRRNFPSFDAALAACEAGIGRCLRDELQEEI